MRNYFEYEDLDVPASETLKKVGIDIDPPMNQYNIDSNLVLDTPYITKGLNLDDYFGTFNSPKMNNSTPQYSSTKLQHNDGSKGRQMLEQTLDKYGITGDKKTTLMKIAYLESGFNPKAQSKNSSATGFFQMIDSTRKQYSNLSKEEFKASPDAQILEQTLNKYGITGDKKTTLMKIAYLESRFNPKAHSNKSSATGYFQMIDSTRKQYSNLSKEEFKASPDAQVLAASRLYDDNIKLLQKKGIKVTGEAIASCWLSPAWAINYFKYGKAGGSDANGTNISKYIKLYQQA